MLETGTLVSDAIIVSLQKRELEDKKWRIIHEITNLIFDLKN